jgi:hypothetical protein
MVDEHVGGLVPDVDDVLGTDFKLTDVVPGLAADGLGGGRHG